MRFLKKATAVVIVCILTIMNISVYAQSSDENKQNNIYLENRIEYVSIDGFDYKYEYKLDGESNRMITITNNDTGQTDILKLDRESGIIFLNNIAWGTVETIWCEDISSDSFAEGNTRGWENRGHFSHYVTWAMGTAAAVVAGAIAIAIGSIGSAAVIAAMGIGSLGVLAACTSGGTEDDYLYFRQYDAYNWQYKYTWRFVANTGDSYGYYDSMLPLNQM